MSKAILCAFGVLEWFALAVFVPVWVRGRGLVRGIVIAGVAVLAGFIVTLTLPAGRALLGGNLALHTYLLCFSIGMAGVCVFASDVLARKWAGQAVVTAIAVLFISSVLFVNPVVEGSPGMRNIVMTTALGTNPAAVCGAALGYDVMRKAGMYEISAIGSYHFTYPAWYATAGIHLAAGIIFAGLSMLRNRRELDE